MDILFVATSSPDKALNYIRLAKAKGVRALPFSLMSDKPSAVPKEIGTSRRANVAGKVEPAYNQLRELINDEVSFYIKIFQLLGYVDPTASEERLKSAITQRLDVLNRENDFDTSLQHVRQTVDGVLAPLPRTIFNTLSTATQSVVTALRDTAMVGIKPRYRKDVLRLLQHPEKIVVAVDDSKISLTANKFSFKNIYKWHTNQTFNNTDSQRQAALTRLIAIIEASAERIASDAWEKAEAVFRKENPIDKLDTIAPIRAFQARKSDFIRGKKQSIIDEFKISKKKFPGAPAATFYEIAGGSVAFYETLFAALGKKDSDTLTMQSSNTINALRLKRDTLTNKLIIEEVQDHDGNVNLTGKGDSLTLIHPDAARKKRSESPTALDDLLELPVSMEEATSSTLPRFNGRTEALQSAGLVSSTGGAKNLLPIDQTAIPIAVIMADQEHINAADQNPLVLELRAQGHTVSPILAGDVLAEVIAHEPFDPSNFRHSRSEELYELIRGNGLFIFDQGSTQEQPAITNLHTLLFKLLDHVMIGPIHDRGKQIVVINPENDTAIEDIIHTAQTHGMASSIPFLHFCNQNNALATCANVINDAPLCLQASTGSKPQAQRCYLPNTEPEEQPTRLTTDDVVLVSLIGSAACHNPIVLEEVEVDLRAFLDQIIKKADGKKIILVHGGGHDGAMGIFDRLSAEYAAHYSDQIGVIAATTPELLQSEAEGKPSSVTINGCLYVIDLNTRAEIVSATDGYLFVAPGGVGTIRELEETARVMASNNTVHIRFGGFSSMPDYKGKLERLIAANNTKEQSDLAIVLTKMTTSALLFMFGKSKAQNA
ncbi:MAG: hypothetical protein ACK5XX_00310 [Holosporales bacterium]|jgi:predicted Rossmann-fold nucleotide-binding protein